MKPTKQNREIIVEDPVCGMKKPADQMKHRSVFLGKTYYFCTQADKEMFDAHPDYWVPKAEREKYRKQQRGQTKLASS